MNIFDYAIKMEQDGEQFYRNMAEKSQKMGFKTILNMLAEDEVKHAEVFKNMKNEVMPDMQNSEVIATSRNIFDQMRNEKIDINSEKDQVELYKKAQGIEAENEAFYREKVNEVSIDAQKKLFLKIADEEKKHAQLLGYIIEMVTRPDRWVEDAEFYHLDEY